MRSEEDLLALSREFDLHELIEDELLMALPVVPKHDECPTRYLSRLLTMILKKPMPKIQPFRCLGRFAGTPKTDWQAQKHLGL